MYECVWLGGKTCTVALRVVIKTRKALYKYRSFTIFTINYLWDLFLFTNIHYFYDCLLCVWFQRLGPKKRESKHNFNSVLKQLLCWDLSWKWYSPPPDCCDFKKKNRKRMIWRLTSDQTQWMVVSLVRSLLNHIHHRWRERKSHWGWRVQ